ncbi:MAG: hypothetical protein ABUL72_04530 [Armatimonadota bacterium]
MRGLTLVPLVVLVTAVTSAQQLQVLSNDEKALALMPARHIANGIVVGQGVSVDGRYIAAWMGNASWADLFGDIGKSLKGDMNPPMPVFRFVVYDRQTRVAEERGSLPKGATPGPISPLDNAGTFLCQATFAPQNGANTQQILISSPGQSRFIGSQALPSGYYAVVDLSGNYWMTVGGDMPSPDNPVAPAKSGTTEDGGVIATVYNSAGQKLLERHGKYYFTLLKGELYMMAGKRSSSYKVNLASGTQEEISPTMPPFSPLPKSTFLTWEFTDTGFSRMPTGSKPQTLSVKVEHTNETLLVAAAVNNFYADPQDRFIVYTDGDAFLMREIGPMPIDLLKAAQRAAVKTMLISNAKQVAVAMMLFAADWDDNLPAGDGWKDKLKPYIKNSDLMKDFVLLLPGVQLSGIKDPANTVLGVISGPGGQAIAYADGHVKWKDG